VCVHNHTRIQTQTHLRTHLLLPLLQLLPLLIYHLPRKCVYVHVCVERTRTLEQLVQMRASKELIQLQLTHTDVLARMHFHMHTHMHTHTHLHTHTHARTHIYTYILTRTSAHTHSSLPSSSTHTLTPTPTLRHSDTHTADTQKNTCTGTHLQEDDFVLLPCDLPRPLIKEKACYLPLNH